MNELFKRIIVHKLIFRECFFPSMWNESVDFFEYTWIFFKNFLIKYFEISGFENI